MRRWRLFLSDSSPSGENIPSTNSGKLSGIKKFNASGNFNRRNRATSTGNNRFYTTSTGNGTRTNLNGSSLYHGNSTGRGNRQHRPPKGYMEY